MISSGAASDAQLVALMGISAAFLASMLGDGYTTMIGLQHGFQEGNPVSRWLFKKIGESWTVFAQAVTGLFVIGAVSNYDLNTSYVVGGILAAGELVMVVRNYLMLKKANISLK